MGLPALVDLIEDDAPSVEDIALSLLKEHRIVPKALPFMVEQVMADDDLRAAVLRKLVEGECRRQLEAQISAKHAAEKRRTGGGPLGEARSSNLEAWAGAVQQALMDNFVLPGGKKLGDADRKDIGNAMYAFQAQSGDLAVKARWMRLIQQSLPADKTVRQTLTEARLEELRAEARKSDE